MPKVSPRQDKSMYLQLREELGLSREKAAELLESITPERIERIENGRFAANPDEVVIMADKYKAPQLCNWYCANECAIGRAYVPEIKMKELSSIVLEMLSSLNSVQHRQERLIDISADGEISASEIEDFLDIQEQLDRISLTADTLRLWTEKKLASGEIDPEAYAAAKAKREQ